MTSQILHAAIISLEILEKRMQGNSAPIEGNIGSYFAEPDKLEILKKQLEIYNDFSLVLTTYCDAYKSYTSTMTECKDFIRGYRVALKRFLKIGGSIGLPIDASNFLEAITETPIILTPSELASEYQVDFKIYYSKDDVETDCETYTGQQAQDLLNLAPRLNLAKLKKGFERLEPLAYIDTTMPLDSIQKSIAKEAKILVKAGY